MNNILFKDARELFDTGDLTNWETIFELLKMQSNPKIRLLACELLVKKKDYKKLELFFNDKDGHVRRYSKLYYYKRACISRIGEKITYNFIPYLDNEEKSKLLEKYPHTITIGTYDFEYFFAKHIEKCFPKIENFNEKEKKELDEFLEEIRKEAFIKTIKASQSSDLAAYVSDDFEIIGAALILEFSNSFIASLLNSYALGIVPDNSIKDN
ncbi:hypothetical protein CLPUN_19710 [Clostridium puniceum]|uniref:Uncharacterized protein n=1 Tax=Clostridium puniceum TaxID=29367 RepID=A0A1S8TLB0_9CLOT|nr:hypothetical protein [Clostridium puniceum]OOM78362.1 hypothetical protein CLPUN_19710 [Clostridium puniceum]